jgi:Na+-transporting methylmalonyl-CoA/oxaloacetate decarboxylase gamma subunit
MEDLIGFTLKFSVIAMGIVFCVLLGIAAVVAVIRRMDGGWQDRERAQAQAAAQRPPTLDELTLVILSAAAATLLAGRTRIRRIRKVVQYEAGSSPWSLQGRATLHGSHVLPKEGHPPHR